MKALDIFSKQWMAFGLEDIRPAATTDPTAPDHDSLPAIPPLDPSCDWLPKLHPQIAEEMAPHRPSESDRNDYQRKRNAIMEQAQVAGVSLPPLFLTLSNTFELQDRIPSCSACYFDLPEHLMSSPFREGDYILCFLNDQQLVVCWYLYLPHDDQPFVISSSCDGTEPFLDTIDLDEDPDSVLEAKASTAVVAKSFDDFIYRFWIENLIWFDLEYELLMSRAELSYIRQILPEFVDPNGG